MGKVTNFNVALLQILPTGSQEANLNKGLECCKKAKQMGADIALFPEMWNILSQLRTRAYENMVGIATVSYPRGQPDCNGHSTAFDGIAYKSENSSSSDMLIVDAGETEGIYIASFPVDELREYRQREIHGNAYRRPEKYHLLISEEKAKPFIRKF